MTWHLVRDVLRRTSSLAIVPLLLSYLTWVFSDEQALTLQTTFAATMTIAFIGGISVGVGGLGSRELLLLPASALDLWRARWILTIGVAGLGGLLGKSLAFATGIRPGDDASSEWATVLLSALYDVGYAGTALVLLAASGVVHGFLRRVLGRRIATYVNVIALLVWIGGWAWPFALRDAIATDVGALAGVRGLLLAAMVAMTIASASWRWVPRPSPGLIYRRAELVSAAPPSAAVLSTAGLHGPTGWRALVWTDWVRTTRLIVLAIAVYVVALVAIATEPGLPLRARLHEIGMLPFDAATRSGRAFFNVMLVGFVSVGGRAFGGGDWLLTMSRHLRVLPLGTRRHLALLFGVPLLAWTTCWAILALLHVSATATLPSILRLEWLLLFAGVDAFARAAQLRLTRDWLQWHFVAFVPLCFGMIAAVETGHAAVIAHRATPAIAGVAYFVMAAITGYGALTRSRTPYAVPPDSLRVA